MFARSVNPQGLMRVNHSRSVETFSANPCMVIKREERTPIAQILRGRLPSGVVRPPKPLPMRPARDAVFGHRADHRLLQRVDVLPQPVPMRSRSRIG